MDKQKCERCKGEEYIPTHQYIKFDGRAHYLEACCWELGKAWFFRGAGAHDKQPIRPGADLDSICSRCNAEGYIPEHQFIIFGDEPAKHLRLDMNCWDLFRSWYFRGARAAGTTEYR